MKAQLTNDSSVSLDDWNLKSLVGLEQIIMRATEEALTVVLRDYTEIELAPVDGSAILEIRHEFFDPDFDKSPARFEIDLCAMAQEYVRICGDGRGGFENEDTESARALLAGLDNAAAIIRAALERKE